ncbi:polymorphic toxin-type HINT domain-containing protein [Streptomyces sioyaensis]|nr:polymorphic toxin-type HINT domain-containing protein [Streptomyces sioyaensis]
MVMLLPLIFDIRQRGLLTNRKRISLRRRMRSRRGRGRVTRAIRALHLSLLCALLAGLLAPAPAWADDGATDPGEQTSALIPARRAWVVEQWKAGGPGVRAAAEVALTGDQDDVMHFFAVVNGETFQDDRVAAAQKANVGGRSLQAAARTALDGTPEDLAAFLEDGWQGPLAEDQRVRVAQIINEGGPGVREAGRAALNGSAEDVRKFLEEGRYTKRDEDQRVELAQILNSGGPEVRTAGRIALNGSADDIREFLEVGQYVARARDEEQTSVAELAEEAREAGRRAKSETEAAKKASAHAVTASELAKKAAKAAATEAEAAKDDSRKAAGAAQRAASAASQAASAAQEAIGAARAATQSARVAANSAAQAASAAAGASQAASRARGAAAAAAINAGDASAARKAAEVARAAAQGADRAADAADEAHKAATDAGDAAQDAVAAGANAQAAANAAEEAGNYAGQSDAHAAQARRAAAEARRHADEATRAANAATALARKAATAAGQARDAARSAAKHANAAAKDADEAADHAGEAASAATKSAAHAKAAQEDADAASAAVDKAKDIYALAREFEAAEILTRTNEGIEHAKDLKADNDELQADRTAAAEELKKFQTEAQRLAAEAGQDGADAKDVVVKGRKVALLAMKSGGPWSQAAAETALGGADDDVAAYVRTGWKEALQQDDRVDVGRLAGESPLESVRNAAEQALKGDAAQISAFLATGQYQAGAEDFRVEIAQVINRGGPGVREAGRAALNSGSTDKYCEFLATGQYTARTEDERVRAAQLINSGGPEMKAAGRIALESPPQLLHTFIEAGQYTAQRKDLLAATHKARVQQLIAEAARTAATAQQNAAEARRVAALAVRKTDEAKKYAKQAQTSADAAKASAAEAAKSAKEAEASAARAAESAKTARKAEADANHAASNAATSAADATVSAQLAHVSANTAWAEARRARASATAAGKDATAAHKAAEEAFNIALDKFKAEAEAQRKAEAEAKKKAAKDPGKIARDQYMCGVMGCDAAHNFPSWCIRNEGYCTILAAGEKLEPGLEKIWKFEKDLIGIGMLQECAQTGDLETCLQLAQDVSFGSKLRLLSRTYRALRFLEKGCTQCFPAGTRVLMGDRSTRNIEDITPGEKVLATDPETGRTAPRKVTRRIVTEDDKHFNELTLTTPNGPRTLNATYEHPFWSPSQHRWLQAQALTPGTTLLSNDGTTVRVQANRPFDKHARTYNLTVDELHTYYVLAGSTPVLVHNSRCGHLEGERDYDVYHPETGNRITDIDHIDDGVLWEEKSALYGDETWISKQIDGKLKKYLEARQHMPGYEDSPIGFRLTNPLIDPRFRAALEQHVGNLRQANPGVDIRLEFAP